MRIAQRLLLVSLVLSASDAPGDDHWNLFGSKTSSWSLYGKGTPDERTHQAAESAAEKPLAHDPRDDFLLVDYGASWCGWCRRWESEQAKDVRCTVEQFDIDKHPSSKSWIATVPVFRLLRYDYQQDRYVDLKRWTGYQTARTINGEVDRQISSSRTSEAWSVPTGWKGSRRRDNLRLEKPPGPATTTRTASDSVEQAKVRRTRSELEAWIRQHYRPSTQHRRAVMGDKSLVWNHLVNEHGFSWEQVRGLPQWMALALHDAVHPQLARGGKVVEPPRISPWKEPP